MRRLKDKTLVPPGAFRFTHETGHTTRSSIYDDWVSRSKDHLRANNLPLPLDFEAQLNDQLCGVIPPEFCDRDPGDTAWVDTRFTWADLAEGMKIFGNWAVSGLSLVEEKEANRRAAICVSCPLNVNISGCSTCHKIASLLTGAVAQKKGAHDDSLRACAICHCALRAMVWFPIEVLAENESSEKQNLRPGFCWAKSGGENYVAAV